MRLFLLLLSVAYLLSLISAVGAFRYPYQLDYGEGYLLHNVYRQSKGENIYSSNVGVPYNFVIYPPVYTIVNIFLGRIFGFKFFTGRLISFLASSFIGFIIYKIVYKLTMRRGAALFSALTFLTSDFVVIWSTLYRVDMLGLLFAVTGLYFILSHYENGYFLIISLILFLLAIFTKLSFVAAPFTAFLYLFGKSRKAALSFLSLLLVVGGSIVLALQRQTDNRFITHVLYYNLNVPPDMFTFFYNLSHLFIRHFGLVAFTFLFAIRNISSSKYSPLVLYFFTSVLLIFTASKAGAGGNYFLELIFVMSLFSGFLVSTKFENHIVPALVFVFFGGFLVRSFSLLFFRVYITQIVLAFYFFLLASGVRCLYKRWRKGLNPVRSSLAYLLMTSLIVTPNISPHLARSINVRSSKLCSEKEEYVKKMISETAPPVLSENSSLLPFGRPGESATELFLLSVMAEEGVLDEEPFLERFRNKYYSLIVLERNINAHYDGVYLFIRLTKNMIKEIKENYRVEETVKSCGGAYYVFVPKSRYHE